jgi:hypothetical protein
MVTVLTTTPVVVPRAGLVPPFTPGLSAVPGRGTALAAKAA